MTHGPEAVVRSGSEPRCRSTSGERRRALALLLIGLLLVLATQPSVARSQRVSSPETVEADSVLGSYASAGRFSGAVLVARAGAAVYRRAFGLANREWLVANVPDAKFRIGSVTKSFTAAAILQLADRGRLALDEPATTYYTLPDAWSRVTIRQLLTHTSGVPSYTDLAGFFGAQSRLDHTPDALIRLTADKPLDFPPGSKFSYDNSGYVVLGAIVERASGMPYAAYLAQNLIGPAGMTSSGYDVDSLVLAKRAYGYEPAGGALRNAPYISMSVPYAAGALYSTVDDLNRWCTALQGGVVLSAASRHAMFTDHGHGYGFGWFIDRSFDRPHVYHGGEVSGFVSRVDMYPADTLTVVVLANQTNVPVNRIAEDLAGLFLGIPRRTAAPHGRDLLSHLIIGVQHGTPDYSALNEELARVVREKLPPMQKRLNSFGKLRSITFSHADQDGTDRYKLVFDQDTSEWAIVVGKDGRLANVTFGPWM